MKNVRKLISVFLCLVMMLSLGVTAFAEEADAEGFADVAEKFRKVAEVEAHHEERYRKLVANIESGEVWVRVGKNRWQCRNCGAIIESERAPEKCPVCDHPKAYFQLEQNNF